MFATLLQVALGGAIGASLRYLSNVAAMRIFGPGFPAGTLFVNILGSFAMGVLIIALAKKGGTHLAPLLLTGILGGFTTFSTYTVDIRRLVEAGRPGIGLVYLAATPCAALAAVWLASATVRRVLTRREQA